MYTARYNAHRFGSMYRSLVHMRALPRYEASLNIAVEIGDKVGQIHASIGMAKNMEMTKQFRLALEYIHRALDLAECIGSKFLAMKCHLYLEQIHTTLGQLEQAWENNKLYKQCVEDLALSCGVCNEVISEKPESLESLQCSHLFHASCLEEYTAGDSRGCPDCRRSLVKPVFV
ncbi:43 kDa receptor-associated protein of the synapse-like [Saccoglossus kowalevskii]|uniref:43 kDa receptor-associated protein of the synapse-like n=1 Tax=Saccoglossus kowalevskii TaxID=10224 RepID=A0ABM0M2T7_SACKO|nr:PREDICTED: 43 kDa receptor-associated protein of the synapse-like [Saccoglossus kowalevskii]